jgi:hypothetical protein
VDEVALGDMKETSVGAILTPRDLLQQFVKLLEPQHHVPSVHCVRGVQESSEPPSYTIISSFLRAGKIERGLTAVGHTILLSSLLRQLGLCHV